MALQDQRDATETAMPKRTDANQISIVSDLRRVGLTVAVTSNVGDGFPDLVVGGRIACPHCAAKFPQNKLVELKTAAGLLTPDQEEFHQIWRGQLDVARTTDDALRITGIVK
jgi:hypothetical protein